MILFDTSGLAGLTREAYLDEYKKRAYEATARCRGGGAGRAING